MNVVTRQIDDKDREQIMDLFLYEAPNQWNYITEDTTNEQLFLIEQGKALATLLETEQGIMGFSLMRLGENCPPRLSRYDTLINIAYIQDVVVSRHFSGRGYGSKLLKESCRQAAKQGFQTVYIERHEENLASSGMMRKSGFEEVETFADPERRFSGSRKTTVMKFSVTDPQIV